MKRFLTTVLFAVSCALSAQKPGASGNYYFAFDAGITSFHPRELNAEGNGISSRFTQLYAYGISMNTVTGGRYGEFAEANIAFHIYRPNFIEWYSDSSSLDERGWELMTSVFGFDLIPGNQKIDFVVAPGVYWGNLKLISESRGGESFRHDYKNPFIAPMARADARFTFWRIAVGARFSFRYDLTKDAWKNKNAGPELPGYHFREAQYMFYAGWLFK